MASSPMASMMARQMINRLAQQGPSAQGPQGPPGAPPQDNAGQQIGAQLSELQGADPQSTMKLLTQIKQQLVIIYMRSAFPLPEVAREVAKAQTSIDKAIDAATKGAGAVNAIANNAGQPQQMREQQDGGQGLPDLSQFGVGAGG